MRPRSRLAPTVRHAAALALLGVVGCTSPEAGHRSLADGSGRALATTAPIELDRPSAAGDYLVGRIALDQGDIATAVRHFALALEAAPDNAELRRQLFILQIAAGDFDAALASARRLGADPDTEEVKLLLALEAVHGGDHATARARFEQFAGRAVTGIAAPLFRAWAAFGAGDRDAALNLVRAGGEAEGLGQLRRYHEAAMLGLVGRPAEGAAQLRAEVTDDAPTALRIVLMLAALEVDAGRRAEAVQVLRRQAGLAGDEPALTALADAVAGGAEVPRPIADARSATADLLLGLAEALSDQRPGSQGLLFARLATWLEPQLPEAWLLIGRIEANQQRYESAVQAFTQVPETSLLAWQAGLARAEALASGGDDAAAQKLLRAMADSRPTDTTALRQLGDLHRRAERYDEAERAYGEAIARLAEPASDDWRLFYARGVALERLKRWPEAETNLLRALELSPDQPLVLNYLGYSWVDQGQHLDRAKAMLHRAVELRSDDGFIVDSLGWAYYRLGDFEQATVYLERAVELEPGDPVINDHLGDAYWRVGREREARFQWQRALTLEPEADVVADIESKLREGLPAVRGAGRG
jgi:Flp pilus assembly protein TadD